MKALITGVYGQLGRALKASAPDGVEVIGHDRDTLDLTDGRAVQCLIGAERPDVVMNAAAWTAVDLAESHEDEARAINADAVGTLAEAARRNNVRLVHVSTDFVFGGLVGTPYRPESPTAPASAYGRTKLAGEQVAGDALIVRTAWVYAPTGSNFVRTMLRLMAERPEVRVVADQVGTPTYAPGLARALWALWQAEATGTYHFTDSGVASWYDFAVAIQEEALAIGLLGKPVQVTPIRTEDFPTPATRPHYSVLDKTATWAALGAAAPHWRNNLRIMLKDVAANG